MKPAVTPRALGITAEPRWGSMENRIWDTGIGVAATRLIGEKLGWKPRYPFEPWFRAMADWLRGNPAIADEYRR